jgi:FkbM family methyltransferase
MKSRFRRAAVQSLCPLFANQWGQAVLERGVALAQYLQGIGSGGEITSSGEAAVLSKLKAMGAASKRDLCIFDVGANTGLFLILARKRLQPLPFHVHSFEPSAPTFEQLCEAARNCGSVTLNNFGLGAQAGEFDLFYDAPGSQHASLTKRNLAHLRMELGMVEKVKIETLDRYCADRQIDRIDLLKIDVEGHELEVLHGAAEMFRNRAIRMVTFEFGGCNVDTRSFVRDFFYFFSAQGMRMARITPCGYFREVSSYREVLEQFRTTNFVSYLATAAAVYSS